MDKIEILECTLRDGSYSIDFQFTPRDTAIIAAALENVGFRLIEIGHGVGLNASATGKGVAAASDEEYMKAAAETIKRAKWGMFFIPGIGRNEDLDMAAEYGMGFVRIGTNANEVEQSEAFIAHAKRLGMHVSSNLMKSYIYPPADLALKAKMAQDFGADLVYLVDSAGTMLPEEVSNYIVAMNQVLSVPVGLHCHDNLSLGIANCLAAINAGAGMVDSTLQGMGRGGGNPATEILLTVLKKTGHDLSINVNRVMDISQQLIRPLQHEKGLDAIDITSGYAGFHSSYLGTILKYSDIYSLDPRDLIVAVCEADRVDAPENLVEGLAKEMYLKKTGSARIHIISLPRFSFPENAGSVTERTLTDTILQVVKSARTKAKKKAKQSVLNIVAPPFIKGSTKVSRFIQEDFGFIISSVELDDIDSLEEIVKAADGVVDIFLVDAESKEYLTQPMIAAIKPYVKESRLIGYKDCDVWVRTVDQEMRALIPEIWNSKITVCGSDPLARRFALCMLEQGADIELLDNKPARLHQWMKALSEFSLSSNELQIEVDPTKAGEGAHAIVTFARGAPLIIEQMVEKMARGGIIFDAGIGTLPSEIIYCCNTRGIRVVRPDMRAALASELASLLGTKRIVKDLMGRRKINNISVVAGGLLGRKGEIVVDSVSNPSKVVGVANGKGKILANCANFQDKIIAVEEEIARAQAFPR